MTLSYRPRGAWETRFGDAKGVDVGIEDYGKVASAPFYQPMFDALWTYAKAHFDGNHLMTWCQGTGQSGSCNSSGSATDGDYAGGSSASASST